MANTRSRRSSRQTRKRSWARRLDQIAVSAGGSNDSDLLAAWSIAMGGAVPVGATIGRVRMTASFDRTSTAADLDALVVGVMVAPGTVEADDIAPLTNPHLDWMFWRKCFISEESTSGLAVANPAWEFDIKAQRRMDEIGMRLWVAVEASPLLAGNFAYGSSVLLVLP